MRRCVNPMCFQGDPGDPPEYVSDCAEECENCSEEIDLDDDVFASTETGYLCEECARVADEEEEEEKEDSPK